MNNNAREKIFKSWTGISEVALIKEVATKGEFIDLCIEYWARKRKIPINEYKLFFHDVVQTYVQRLLTERLVCKAENVLRNVQRDVRCCYYQFACECEDEELRETVLEHLRRKDPHNVNTENNDDLLEFHFNYELLQQIKEHPDLLGKCKSHLPHQRFNLEAMYALEGNFRKRILVELFFISGNNNLLPHLNKQAVWNFLVESQKSEELIVWCSKEYSMGEKKGENNSEKSLLEQQYKYWLPLDNEMYEFALKTLRDPPTVLRDCFARAGHFFKDEIDNVVKILPRICRTRSFDINRELLEKLPMARYLFEHDEYILLLRPFVNVRELNELADEFPEHSKLFELLATLKTHNLEEREGFEKVSYAVTMYLKSGEQKQSPDQQSHSSPQFENPEEPLVDFFEYLCYEPTIASLNCFLRSSALQRIPYLVALSERLDLGPKNLNPQSPIQNSAHKTLPSAYDMLRKYKNIDFKGLNRDSPTTSNSQEIACFSNARLCQRYARKYQLNFLHYLKQQRSAYALYYLLTAHLQSYAQLTRPQLFSACETVTELALQHANSKDLVVHCVAFTEMLGFDTQPLRILLKLSHLLGEDKIITDIGTLVSQVEDQLLHRLQNSREDSIETFPLSQYQALMHLVVCQGQNQRQWPGKLLQHYAGLNDWWRLLILLQYFNIPLEHLQQLVAHFETRQIGEHLLRALSYEAPPSTQTTTERGSNGVSSIKRHGNSSTMRQRKSNAENVPPVTTSIETLMTSSLSSCNDTSGNAASLSPRILEQVHQLRFLAVIDQVMAPNQPTKGKLDLFALILLSGTNAAPEDPMPVTCVSKFLELIQDNQSKHSMSWNLLRYCVKYNLPVLAILAATVNPANVAWHWLVWLAIVNDQWTDLLHFAVQIKDKSSDLAWHTIEQAVRQGNVVTVYRSLCIFYGEDQEPLVHLFRFLYMTQSNREFDEKAVNELSLYLLAWSNDEVRLPLADVKAETSNSSSSFVEREQLLQRTMQLFLVHLQQNFDSILEQQGFLSCICRSGMTDLCGGRFDFCLLNEVFSILQSTAGSKQFYPQSFAINFERLLQEQPQQKDINEEYQRLLKAFLDARAYEAAIRLASLLHLPICDIVYAKWISSLDEKEESTKTEEIISDCNDFSLHEAEVVEHSLPPEVLVNFFLHAASRLDETINARRKYILLQHALNVIKKHLLFPNESFDRDQIEYSMVLCYLHLDEKDIKSLEIYHSEYYEQIMLKERCVLYKSFLELKELAGIEDLNTGSIRTPLTDLMQQRLEALLHRLLDEGDIVEALRLQELFECRPLDLRFIVFCMALAEGVTTIFSMSSEERQLLRDVEKSAFAKFNRRTLDTLRANVSQSNPQTYSSSPTRDEFSDSCSTLEFEEIPSKEKRETLETIQGIASKLKHGVDLGKRIVMAYRAAMYLDKEYLDVLRTKDANILLRSVAEETCLHRLMVVSDIMTSTHMTAQEIADLLAFEITTAVVRPRFYIFSVDQQAKSSFKNAELWGYNIDRDLHLFLELTPNTTKLGNHLLEYCDALKSYRKYQDNKPYEHSVTFERLAEIIRIYGLPHTAAAGAASTAPPNDGSGGLSTIASTSIPSTTTILPSTMVTSLMVGIAASTMMSAMIAGGSNVTNGISSPHPPQVLSHKKQNLIYVELLIKAHQCFVHECSMEGIANVLNRAKALNAVLTKAKSWSLIVRMLIGIARYREMFYCFDSLIENEQFESLLGQFDEEKTIGLRQAILAYLREYEPANSRELLKLAALHFLMYKDLAEMWEQDAQMLIAKVLNMASLPTNNEQPSIGRLRCSMEVINLLQQALQNYTHATENYLLDNKLLLAQKSASMAEVIAMQIDLVNKNNNIGGLGGGAGGGSLTASRNNQMYASSCISVLNVQTRDEFRELVNAELSVPQALILSRGYAFDINWTEALLSQYVLLMRKSYLRDFLALMSINDGIIENVVKGFQRYMQNNHKSLPLMEEHLAHLVTLVRSVTLKYKLASVLSIKSFVMSAINDQTVHYLKDTNYGRNESHRMADV